MRPGLLYIGFWAFKTKAEKKKKNTLGGTVPDQLFNFLKSKYGVASTIVEMGCNSKHCRHCRSAEALSPFLLKRATVKARGGGSYHMTFSVLLGYNLVDALKRYQHDADCELFHK